MVVSTEAQTALEKKGKGKTQFEGELAAETSLHPNPPFPSPLSLIPFSYLPSHPHLLRIHNMMSSISISQYINVSIERLARLRRMLQTTLHEVRKERDGWCSQNGGMKKGCSTLQEGGEGMRQERDGWYSMNGGTKKA